MFRNESLSHKDLTGNKLVIAVFFMAMLMFMGSFVNTPVAHASGGNCLDIKGQGKAVMVPGPGGVANAGIIYFELPNSPAIGYQACVEDPGNDGIGPFDVKGWAWDDNLGWISLYCNGGLNLGIACGAVNYGVTIDDTGKFSGYAWGDNTGWIKFDNGAFAQLLVDRSESLCQGYVYGVTLPKPTCPAHTARDSHVWSDNLGWINLEGMLIPWYSVSKELQVEVSLDPFLQNKWSAKFANGVSAYKLVIKIADKTGVPIKDSRYVFYFAPQWLKDTVKYNQVDNSLTNRLAAVAPCTADAKKATSKPCVTADFSNHVVNSGMWYGNITSEAPTSNMNILFDPPHNFEYEKFIVPSGLDVIERNELQLGKVGVMVYDIDTQSWPIAKDNVPTDYAYYDVYRDETGIPAASTMIPFRPITEIYPFYQKAGSDTLEVYKDIPYSFTATKTGSGTVTYHVGISPAVAGLKFTFDNGDGKISWASDNAMADTTTAWNLIAGLIQDPTKTVNQLASGFYIYTDVYEPTMCSSINPAICARYYSNKLPRVTGSTGVQPVVVVRGSVYSSGAVTSTQTGEAVISLGDRGTDKFRNAIYKNVKNILAGTTKGTTCGATTNINTFFTNADACVARLAGDTVYYVKGSDVYLNNVTWRADTTFIVEGGNVFITGNLVPAIDRAKLGLVVLKDLSQNAAQQANEGHIYILNNVTKIKANIYADDAVFSYDSLHVPGGGEPNWVDLDTYKEATKFTQLLIDGSLASLNTIGGATRSPKIIGTGAETTDTLKAQIYDLNYLRQYSGRINRDINGNALNSAGVVTSDASLKLINASGDPWSAYETPSSGDLYPPNDLVFSDAGLYFSAFTGTDAQKNLGSTYIFYNPPTGLKVFDIPAEYTQTIRPR